MAAQPDVRMKGVIKSSTSRIARSSQTSRVRSSMMDHGRGPPHEEAAKDAAVHVALLGLAGEGVGQLGGLHQHRIPPRQGWQVQHCACLCQQRLRPLRLPAALLCTTRAEISASLSPLAPHQHHNHSPHTKHVFRVFSAGVRHGWPIADSLNPTCHELNRCASCPIFLASRAC